MCVNPNSSAAEFITFGERVNQPVVLQLPYADNDGRGQILERADLINYQMRDFVGYLNSAIKAILNQSSSQDEDKESSVED